MSNTTFLQEPEPLDREQSIELYVKARLQSLDRAVGGYTSVSLQGLTGTVDLTPTQAKHRRIKLTGAPSGAVTLRIPHATGAVADPTFVNACTGSNSTVTVKSTGANVGNSSGVPLVAGETRHVSHDGESAYGLGGGPTAWAGVTFQNSWTNYGSSYQNAQYRKLGDVVQARGAVKSGTVGTVIFTLPAGFRPPAKTVFPADLNGAYGRLEVGTDGTVTQLSPTGNTFFAFTFQFSVTS